MTVDFTQVWPVVGALVAGAVIGFEREYRARPAGFRTHALVSVSSALLMLVAVRQDTWAHALIEQQLIRADPVRMAQGILSGIGFLGAGVIFREKFSVHGLTTAASLWLAAAIGVAFGVSMYGLAIGCTVLTLGVLVLFRWIEATGPGTFIMDVEIVYPRDRAPSEIELTAWFKQHGFSSRPAAHRLFDEGRFIEIATVVRARGQYRPAALSAALLADGRASAFDITPR